MQTMGYIPVIDCYEVSTGAKWSSRNEILAVGAGPSLFLRLKNTGDIAEKEWNSGGSPIGSNNDYLYHHQTGWITDRDDKYHSGRDDISSVNILRPWQNDTRSLQEEVIVGRLSGELERRQICFLTGKTKRQSIYVTDGRMVRSAHISSAAEPLLEACLDHETVALYRASSDVAKQEPCAVVPFEVVTRVRTARFLSPTRLALCVNSYKQPVHVYNISPDGIPTTSSCFSDPKPSIQLTRPYDSSVFSIAALNPSSSAGFGAAEGDLFLIGQHNGVAELHDLRYPGSQAVAKYYDPYNSDSPI